MRRERAIAGRRWAGGVWWRVWRRWDRGSFRKREVDRRQSKRLVLSFRHIDQLEKGGFGIAGFNGRVLGLLERVMALLRWLQREIGVASHAWSPIV
jgi:hypothetical protein